MQITNITQKIEIFAIPSLQVAKAICCSSGSPAAEEL